MTYPIGQGGSVVVFALNALGTLFAAATGEQALAMLGAVLTFLSPYLYLAVKTWLDGFGTSREERIRAVIRAELDELARRNPRLVLPPDGPEPDTADAIPRIPRLPP